MEIWSKKEEDETKAKDIKVLMGKARFSRFMTDVYAASYANKLKCTSFRETRHYTNRWTEPPVGLNVKKLKAGMRVAVC